MPAGTHAQPATQLEWLTNTSLSLCKVGFQSGKYDLLAHIFKKCLTKDFFLPRAPRDQAYGRGSTSGVASWDCSTLWGSGPPTTIYHLAKRGSSHCNRLVLAKTVLHLCIVSVIHVLCVVEWLSMFYFGFELRNFSTAWSSFCSTIP